MKWLCIFISTFVCFTTIPAFAGQTDKVTPVQEWQLSDAQQTFLDQLQHDTFNFFWETTNPDNGLTPDRYPDPEFSSVAAVGFALSAYLVGVENHYISREQAARRTLTTLQFLREAPQGDAARDVTGYKGFFYHFLDMDNGRRHRQTELSTIDTALLMAGVLSSQTYFDRDNPTEARIRSCADALYRRVDWAWARSPKHKPLLSMGWRPEKGFIDAYWRGYNEGMILYILALGSPTHPLDAAAWQKWTATYNWDSHYDNPHVNFGPLFGHQYSHIWIDFRKIQDDYMRSRGIDYFINSTRATYANREYCVVNPRGWEGYSGKVWGLTACDGPDDAFVSGNDETPRRFYKYLARGSSADYLRDDGTIAPTAAGGSVPFAPEITIPTLAYFKTRWGDKLYGRYGFTDAFNLSYRKASAPEGWFDKHYLGIDQGPILLMIDNYRTGFLWDLMKKNLYIRKGLQKAGFSGGWLRTFTVGQTNGVAPAVRFSSKLFKVQGRREPGDDPGPENRLTDGYAPNPQAPAATGSESPHT